MKICFGIISYFPWKQPDRLERQNRLDRLVNQLSSFWPNIPIMIISQQWKYYNLNGKCANKIIRFDYPALGILGARQELRKHFLESEYDYLIMFDDDAIIKCDNSLAHKDYIKEIEKHPDGFCFIKGNGSSPYTDYNDSQLNLCAISKWIYEREPIPNIDPQKSQAFEDRIWSTLLHFKYSEKEFSVRDEIRCIHFKNPNETAPSTWSNEQQYNWRAMRNNTKIIEEYISKYKDLPDMDLLLGNKKDVDGNNYIQLIGNCSDIGYLGRDRIHGPTDNCLTKGIKTVDYLIHNTYLDHIKNDKPTIFNRKPSFEGDLTVGYDYDSVQIIHNNPLEEKYIEELNDRVRTFNTFYNLSKENNNFYFVCCLNMYDIDNTTNLLVDNHFEDIVKYIKEQNILDKCIFVQTKTVNVPKTANWWAKDIDNIIKKYNLKMITIDDNLIRGPGVDIAHNQFIEKVKGIL